MILIPPFPACSGVYHIASLTSTIITFQVPLTLSVCKLAFQISLKMSTFQYKPLIFAEMEENSEGSQSLIFPPMWHFHPGEKDWSFTIFHVAVDLHSSSRCTSTLPSVLLFTVMHFAFDHLAPIQTKAQMFGETVTQFTLCPSKPYWPF